jgi:hypothetical protein
LITNVKSKKLNSINKLAIRLCLPVLDREDQEEILTPALFGLPAPAHGVPTPRNPSSPDLSIANGRRGSSCDMSANPYEATGSCKAGSLRSAFQRAL